MKKSRLILLILVILTAFSITACTGDSPDQPNMDTLEEEPVVNEAETVEEEITVDRISVVATLFPQYDFARIIGGDHVDVKYLLPPGTEAHSYEPTPQDMVMLLGADLFLYTGEIMEPWAKNMVINMQEEGVKIVDLSEGIILISAEEHDHHHDHDHSHDEEYDPHYWTDPNMAMIMVDAITEALVLSDSDNEVEYRENASKLKHELIELDGDIRSALEKTKSNTILSGGHFAFGYFAKQYGLDHMSPYVGFSPNAEPTPQRITALIQRINETGAKAIFHEELIDPKVARVIVDETGIQMLLLHGVHNVSKEELESGKTYIDFMYENLENLKEGLGYEE